MFHVLICFSLSFSFSFLFYLYLITHRNMFWFQIENTILEWWPNSWLEQITRYGRKKPTTIETAFAHQNNNKCWLNRNKNRRKMKTKQSMEEEKERENRSEEVCGVWRMRNTTTNFQISESVSTSAFVSHILVCCCVWNIFSVFFLNWRFDYLIDCMAGKKNVPRKNHNECKHNQYCMWFLECM